MDKLNAFASQAKAKADEGRLKAMAHVDSRFPSSKAQGAGQGQGQGQVTETPTCAPASSSSAGYRPHASGPPPPPPGRSRASSGTTAGAGNASFRSTSTASSPVFAQITTEEKTAFFSLLDEYFQSRPAYAHLLKPQDFSTPVNVHTGQQQNSSSVAAAAPVRRATPQAPPPVQPAATSTTATTRGLGVARALYDFEGQNPAEDLAFTEGQRITVLEQIDDDWLRGQLGTKQGMFPKSYVEMEQQ